MKNDTYLNILMSYAYLYGDKPLLSYLKEQTANGVVNLMIDSGAFTKYNSKAKMSHVNVNEYCDFLYEMGQYSEKYVMLDVVGQAEESKKKYEFMLSKGLNPMFVATMFDKDYLYIQQAVEQNPDICVAGGVTTKSDWMTKRFQDIYKKTGNKARIHGLGYVTFPKMLQLPLVSVDSSTWKTGPARFGCGVYFVQDQIKQLRWVDVLKGKKIPSEIKKQLDDYGISAKMYAKREYHRREISIEAFMSLVNMIRLQKYCKRHCLDYFLAVGSKKDLSQIIYVSNHINTLTYEKFINTFHDAH